MSQAASINPAYAGRGRNGTEAMRRWGALIGGGALAVYGLTRMSPAGLVVAGAGGALLYVGANTQANRAPIARSSVTLNCAPEEAYRFWRDFENLPRFMHHIESVSVTGDRRSRWVALGPMGKEIRWDAEIVNEQPNEFIAWRSLPGSDIEVDGRVDFRRASGNRGTVVSAVIQYRPPGGQIGHVLAKILGKDPNFLMEQDLRRFKALIETGEIPTVEGQPHGRRSAKIAAARLMDPDRPFRRDARIGEVFGARRRAS